MSRETSISLGKRATSEFDNSCNYGIVFGEIVVEIEQYDITLCYKEKPSDSVLERIVDLAVVQTSATAFDSDIAFKEIPYDVATRLERLLRSLIKRELEWKEYIDELYAITKELETLRKEKQLIKK